MTIDMALDLLEFFRLVVHAAHAYRQTYPEAEAQWRILPVTIAPALAIPGHDTLYHAYEADMVAAAQSEALRLLQAIARHGLAGKPPVLALPLPEERQALHALLTHRVEPPPSSPKPSTPPDTPPGPAGASRASHSVDASERITLLQRITRS